jgi:hypothetical protein
VRILSVVWMITDRPTGNEHKRGGPKLPHQAVVIRQSAKHRLGRNAIAHGGGVGSSHGFRTDPSFRFLRFF